MHLPKDEDRCQAVELWQENDLGLSETGLMP